MNVSRRRATLLVVLSVGTLFLDVMFYNFVSSRYALTNWWLPQSLKTIELVGILLLAGGTSLVTGYVSRLLWLCPLPHILALTLPQAVMGLPLLQGFVLPTGLASSLIFGWIGTRLPRTPSAQ